MAMQMGLPISWTLNTWVSTWLSVATRLKIEDLIVAHPSTDSSNLPPTLEEQQSVYEDFTNFWIQ